MNGSHGEPGRQGSAGTALQPRRWAAGAEEGRARRWEKPDHGLCLLCRREARRPTCRCERWERVEEVLAEREPGRLIWGRPRWPAVCKDCCIGALEGHRCVWWDLCWRE
jgi:hypothetical protein